MEGSVGSAPEGGEKFYFGFLSGNALKILACLLMLTDHIGMILFSEVSALRAVGRLSMPIFAFMFAEGCHYTRHKISTSRSSLRSALSQARAYRS